MLHQSETLCFTVLLCDLTEVLVGGTDGEPGVKLQGEGSGGDGKDVGTQSQFAGLFVRHIHTQACTQPIPVGEQVCQITQGSKLLAGHQMHGGNELQRSGKGVVAIMGGGCMSTCALGLDGDDVIPGLFNGETYTGLLLDTGAVDETGRMLDADEAEGPVAEYLGERR